MSVVFTVGYEATDIERFVRTMKAAGIKQIADVRAVAQSRKKGFSKRGLAERLEAEGISYLHFVDLGDPKPGREAARAGRYDEFRKIYGKHLKSDQAQAALKRLIEAVSLKATCLLCFERDPSTCHRRMIADELSADIGCNVQHLYADDPVRYVRNAKDLPRFYPRESVAAAQ
ncbi:DUF488 domain-containing protein [Paracoccus onubensis]|uniref:DUF488 domain-containing protein n=1 Tax=Paracoccus onubensis TaxID=1675788 RepID=A0A418T1W8_9RHOB|nr:DUF488 domain-containing protein [Paracoccus onubensis]RJE87120.1 DUF488 domain-containing protein [Paracoccus onubensis]